MEKIAIIIPSFNEKNNISILIKKLIKLIPGAIIFVVDDNSPDRTDRVVENLAKRNKKIMLIKRNGKGGRGGAVIVGLKEAFKDKNIKKFVEMDADLSHLPEEVEKLLKTPNPDAVVIGSRYIKGSKILNWPLYRRIQSKLANFYIGMILGVPINDFTNGFRSYSRKAVDFILKKDINHKGFVALSETAFILHKKKFNLIEIPITFKDRERGKSNATFSEVLKSLIAIIEIKMRS